MASQTSTVRSPTPGATSLRSRTRANPPTPPAIADPDCSKPRKWVILSTHHEKNAPALPPRSHFGNQRHLAIRKASYYARFGDTTRAGATTAQARARSEIRSAAAHGVDDSARERA